ncbi:MAG: Ham1 family protein [Candidatus Saccharibacteria bacterium]|nr:Ham1 family protein [Candidatus Saccharibacteria bacterium]
MKVTFITGNQHKADLLAKFLGYPLGHHKLDLDEIQSLSLQKIAEHKARQAYGIIKSPVLVEDISFSISDLGKLPGPFIKWFINELDFEGLCRLADRDPERKAITSVCFAYFDGTRLQFFEGELKGRMPQHPKGDDGFGWNCVFIPEGQDKTNAEMTDEEMELFSLRTTTVYPQIKLFLEELVQTDWA